MGKSPGKDNNSNDDRNSKSSVLSKKSRPERRLKEKKVDGQQGKTDDHKGFKKWKTEYRKQRDEELEKSYGYLKKQNVFSRIWKATLSRLTLLACLMVLVYYTAKRTRDSNELILASSILSYDTTRIQGIPCNAQDYATDKEKFKGCDPTTTSKGCARIVSDSLVSHEEAHHLLSIAKRGMSYGGGSGGATILDLHSGTLSFQQSFVNLYKLKTKENKTAFNELDFQIYKTVKNKIYEMITIEFGVVPHKLYLTQPTFFSRMTSKDPSTIHDEYWHTHIDKETYKSFTYTSLLYLSTYEKDFHGGRFVFVGGNKNVTIEPKFGRVSAFTSGSENPHFVERVTKGTRYALTVSFTCDPNYAIKDPEISML